MILVKRSFHYLSQKNTVTRGLSHTDSPNKRGEGSRNDLSVKLGSIFQVTQSAASGEPLARISYAQQA